MTNLKSKITTLLVTSLVGISFTASASDIKIVSLDDLATETQASVELITADLQSKIASDVLTSKKLTINNAKLKLAKVHSTKMKPVTTLKTDERAIAE